MALYIIGPVFIMLIAFVIGRVGRYSPDSPRGMSPDTMSPIYPDRPIRPLPTRRLRERLSPDVAETIKYPPTPATSTPLFYYPYAVNGDEDRPRGEQYQIDRQRADEIERNYISRRNKIGEGDVGNADSDEEYLESATRGRYSRHSPDPFGRSYRYVQKPETSKFVKPQAPASITSSADGYDSFENTNNKKKRKIPTPGDPGLNGIHLSNDLASLGISHATDESLARDDSLQYYSSPGSGSGQGFSGPGRGRYGRVGNGRSPLRTLSDASSYSNGRNPKQRQSQWSSGEATGIISTAIANAEKLPVTPSSGQENISLLQQQAAKKSSPASAQFTFTCDSQVPGTVAWPGPPPNKDTMGQGSSQRSTNTQATQTSPIAPMAGTPRQGLGDSQHAPKHNGKQGTQGKKTRRRTGKEYLIAARQRREQQEYQNYHNPVSPEDEWICEFCEYERIFGTPPEALIKQYEIKDRHVRKQEAERRRLLEKAKLKGRKGKKGSKLAPKNNPAPQDKHSQQQTQPPAERNYSQSQSQGTQSEEYYEDDYEEETQDGQFPQSPTGPPISDHRKYSTHTDQELAYAKRRTLPVGLGTGEQLVS